MNSLFQRLVEVDVLYFKELLLIASSFFSPCPFFLFLLFFFSLQVLLHRLLLLLVIAMTAFTYASRHRRAPLSLSSWGYYNDINIRVYFSFAIILAAQPLSPPPSLPDVSEELKC